MTSLNQLRRRNVFASEPGVNTPAGSAMFRRTSSSATASGGTGVLGNTPFAQRYFTRDIGTQRRSSPSAISPNRLHIPSISVPKPWRSSIPASSSRWREGNYNSSQSDYHRRSSYDTDINNSSLRRAGVMIGLMGMSLTLLVCCHKVDSWVIAVLMYLSGCISGISFIIMLFKAIFDGIQSLWYGDNGNTYYITNQYDGMDPSLMDRSLDPNHTSNDTDAFAHLRMNQPHTSNHLANAQSGSSPIRKKKKSMVTDSSWIPQFAGETPAVVNADKRRRRDEANLERVARYQVSQVGKNLDLTDAADVKGRAKQHLNGAMHGSNSSLNRMYGGSENVNPAAHHHHKPSSMAAAAGRGGSPQRRKVFDRKALVDSTRLNERWNDHGQHCPIRKPVNHASSSTSSASGVGIDCTPISSLLKSSTSAFTPATVAAAQASSSASPNTFRIPMRNDPSAVVASSPSRLVLSGPSSIPSGGSPFSRRKEIEKHRQSTQANNGTGMGGTSGGGGYSEWMSLDDNRGGGSSRNNHINFNSEVSSASHMLIKRLSLESLIHHWSHNARQWIHSEVSALFNQIEHTDKQVWECIEKLKEWYPKMRSNFEALRTVQERVQIFMSNHDAVKNAAEQKKTVQMMNVWQKRAHLNRALRHIIGETRKVKDESDEWAIESSFEALSKLQNMFGDSSTRSHISSGSHSLLGWKRESAVVMNAVKQRMDDLLCPAAVFSEDFFITIDSEECLNSSGRIRQQLLNSGKFKGIAICAVTESLSGTLDVPYYFIAFESALTSGSGMTSVGGYSGADSMGLSLSRGGSIDVWLPVPGERNVYQCIALFSAFVQRFLRGNLAGKDLSAQSGLFDQILHQ